MKLKDFLGVLLLAALWSPTFMFIKIGGEEIPPLTFTCLRCLLAFLTLLPISLLRAPLFKLIRSHWKPLAISALIGNALPFALCCFGEIHTTSALAGVIEGTVPLFTLLLTRIFIPNEKLKLNHLIGVTIGFIGLMVIFYPKLYGSEPEMGSGSLIGELALIAMAISFAGSFIYSKVKLSSEPPLGIITIQMLMAALWLAPFSLMLEQPWQLSLPSPAAVSSLVNLAMFCTSLSWLLYYYLIKNLTASQVSLAAYLCPVGSIFLGVFYLGEEVAMITGFGTAIIILAMCIAGGVFRMSSKELNKIAID